MWVFNDVGAAARQQQCSAAICLVITCEAVCRATANMIAADRAKAPFTAGQERRHTVSAWPVRPPSVSHDGSCVVDMPELEDFVRASASGNADASGSRGQSDRQERSIEHAVAASDPVLPQARHTPSGTVHHLQDPAHVPLARQLHQVYLEQRGADGKPTFDPFAVEGLAPDSRSFCGSLPAKRHTTESVQYSLQAASMPGASTQGGSAPGEAALMAWQRGSQLTIAGDASDRRVTGSAPWQRVVV
jgi:hypothetical protein